MSTAANYGFIIPSNAVEVSGQVGGRPTQQPSNPFSIPVVTDNVIDLDTQAPPGEHDGSSSHAGAELPSPETSFVKKAVGFFPIEPPEQSEAQQTPPFSRDDSMGNLSGWSQRQGSLREGSEVRRSRSASYADDELSSFATRKRTSFQEGSSFGSQSRGGSFKVDQDGEETESFNTRRRNSMSALNRNSQLLRSQHTVNNLLAMSGIGGQSGITDKAVFKRDVDVVRKRLKQISQRTLDPRSNFVRTWDLITILALAFTAFVTPFEVSFFAAKIYSGPVNFTLNRLVDAIFFFDIVVCFFLPYRAPVKEGGMMVYDNRKVAIAYLKGWFFLDLITCIPFDVFFAAVASAGGLTVDASVYSYMRMFRILKLVRIVRASRIIGRWQDHVAISFALLSLIKFSFLTIILAHWLACLWGFVGVKWEELPESTRDLVFSGGNSSDHALSYSDWARGGGIGGHMSWRQKAGVPDDASPYDIYGICLCE